MPDRNSLPFVFLKKRGVLGHGVPSGVRDAGGVSPTDFAIGLPCAPRVGKQNGPDALFVASCRQSVNHFRRLNGGFGLSPLVIAAPSLPNRHQHGGSHFATAPTADRCYFGQAPLSIARDASGFHLYR